MATKSPRQFHSQWPNVASASELPNVALAAIQDAALEVGDIAFVTGGDMYVCIDDTLGAAVWQIIGTAAGSRDRRAPALIVGNALLGDTLNDCDYVDPGDGSGIVAALAAAGATPLDVYIRPGLYDLNLGTSGGAPLTVPAGVTVRGAGIGITRVRAADKDTGLGFVQTVFTLNELSELWDVTIEVPPPIEAATSLYVVALADRQAMAQRVQVLLTGTWLEASVGFTGLQACFGQDVTAGFAYDVKVIDCVCGSAAVQLPSFIDIGTVPAANGLRAVAGEAVSGLGYAGITVERLISWGGDHGIVFNGELGQAHDCIINRPFRYGCWIAGSQNTFADSKVVQMVMDPAPRGVYVSAADGHSDIIDNFLYNLSPSGVGEAIELNASKANLVRGNRTDRTGQWGVGISLTVGADDNIVNGNNMATAVVGYSDLGSNNDLSHNK